MSTQWKVIAVVLVVGLLLTFANMLFWSGERMDPECLFYYNEGTGFFKDGQYEKAIQAFLEVARRNQSYASVYYYLGLSYEAASKPGFAIQAYKKTIALSPRDVKAYTSLASLYDIMGNYKDSAACFQMAARINPSNPQIWYGLGVVQAKGRQFDDARVSLDKAQSLYMRRDNPAGVQQTQDQINSLE